MRKILTKNTSLLIVAYILLTDILQRKAPLGGFVSIMRFYKHKKVRLGYMKWDDKFSGVPKKNKSVKYFFLYLPLLKYLAGLAVA